VGHALPPMPRVGQEIALAELAEKRLTQKHINTITITRMRFMSISAMTSGLEQQLDLKYLDIIFANIIAL
jgi:hypothetical protein